MVATVVVAIHPTHARVAAATGERAGIAAIEGARIAAQSRGAPARPGRASTRHGEATAAASQRRGAASATTARDGTTYASASTARDGTTTYAYASALRDGASTSTSATTVRDGTTASASTSAAATTTKPLRHCRGGGRKADEQGRAGR
jgi:hypothetical protein